MATQGTIDAQSHTYADGPNDYTVTVKVTDKDGDSDSKTFSVHVNNVAPTATFTASSPIDEGSSSTLSFTGASDPTRPTRRRVPLLVRLRRPHRLARKHLRERRHLGNDDLPLRRQRLLHGQGPDLRPG